MSLNVRPVSSRKELKTFIKLLLVEIGLMIEQNYLFLIKGIKSDYTFRINKNIKKFSGELSTVFPTPYGDQILTILLENSRIIEVILIDPRKVNEKAIIGFLKYIPDVLRIPFLKINGFVIE